MHAAAIILFLSLLAACAENAYFQEFSMLPSSYQRHGEPLIQGGEAKRPDLREYRAQRDALVQKYAWAIPCQEAIYAIKEASPQGVVDFGAGAGYWASLLADVGCNVVALDNWQDGKPTNMWFKVQTGSYERLPALRNRTLLLCYPPRGNFMAVNAVRVWGGQTLIYVGEPAPARSTANPAFFDELEKHWRLTKRVPIPQWFNRDDGLFIYQRK